MTYKDFQNNSVQAKAPNNSSISSLTEIAPPKNKKNQSLRDESDKNVGGQMGRKDVTLAISEKPDDIIVL